MSDKKPARRPTPNIAENDLPPVEIFFDARDSAYWYRLNGHFCALKKGDLKMHLQTIGYSDFPSRKIPGLNVIDVPFHEAMMQRMVHFTGPLSGHKVGPFFDYAGKRCLVTEGPNPLIYAPPKKFKAPKRLLDFMAELLPGEQYDFCLWWLKLARQSQLLGDFRPGQVAVFAGKAGCGKSLMQNIITEILGGRVADPFRYMMGLTVFNADIASAEHWQMSDPPSTTDMRTRLKFGDYIKDATVNRDLAVHGKGKNALCLLPVFHRITISVNDEPECLAVIPPLIESLIDKVFLFRCERANVGSEREKTWAWVKQELPAMLAFLDAMPMPPKELSDDRFGIRAWQHPELLDELTALNAETRLLQIVDQVLFSGNPATWPGLTETKFKAMDLEQKLRKSDYSFACEKLLSYSGACGSHLAKLAKSLPARVQKTVRDGTSFWQILPPQFTEEKLAA